MQTIIYKLPLGGNTVHVLLYLSCDELATCPRCSLSFLPSQPRSVFSWELNQDEWNVIVQRFLLKSLLAWLVAHYLQLHHQWMNLWWGYSTTDKSSSFLLLVINITAICCSVLCSSYCLQCKANQVNLTFWSDECFSRCIRCSFTSKETIIPPHSCHLCFTESSYASSIHIISCI